MKKRVALIGYGGMAHWHKNAILNSDCVELAGVCDIRECQRKAALADGLPLYADAAAAFADPTVDFVVLAVPNDLHKPLAIQAMAAGKHVISEKPVTVSCADLKEMLDAADRYHRVFSVHQNRRWDGDFRMVKSLWEENTVGHIHLIESRYHGSRGIPGDWRKEKEHGGGMILDWGIHLIDQALQICGVPDRVYCVCDHLTNAEVDDGFKLDLYYDRLGCTYRIEVGTHNFISLPRFYVLGADGSAVVDTFQSPARVVSCHQFLQDHVVPVETAAGLTKTMAPRDATTTSEFELPMPHPDVHEYYRNFCAAIDGKEPLLVTHEQMMQDMRLMELAFLSDAEKKPVPYTPYKG